MMTDVELENFDLHGKKIFLYGCGRFGQSVSNFFSICSNQKIDGFISDLDKQQGITFDGIEVFSPKNILELPNKLIVIATNKNTDKDQESIFKRLVSFGLTYKKDFVKYQDFLRFLFFKHGKLFQTMGVVSITDKCTLKCKHCSMRVPYVSHPQNRKLEDVIRDAEAYFKYIDYCTLFKFSGGEATLHPQLHEMINILGGGDTKKKIHTIGIITNGTVSFSEDLLKSLQKYNCLVEISDYDLKIAQSKRGELLEKLNSYGIKYELIPVGKLWVDIYGDPCEIKHSEEETKKLFQRCPTICRAVYDEKYYSCDLQYMAEKRGYIGESEYDYIDLRDNGNIQSVKEKIFDLVNKRVEKGYISFCRRCYSVNNELNNRHIPAAEQL